VAVGAVIFDMDGLMFDTERVAQVAWYRALADRGFVVTDDVYATVIGRTAPDTRAILVAALGTGLPIEAIEAATSDYLRELLEPAPPLKPGLLELLDDIGCLGLRAAVASSTARSEVRRRLEACGLEDRFDVVRRWRRRGRRQAGPRPLPAGEPSAACRGGRLRRARGFGAGHTGRVGCGNAGHLRPRHACAFERMLRSRNLRGPFTRGSRRLAARLAVGLAASLGYGFMTLE